MNLQPLNSQLTELHLPAAATADVCDANSNARCLMSPFVRFGGNERCSGPAEIISTRYDNSLVKGVLQEPGAGRVLLIDNGGSITCAMLGGNLAALAANNGWAGIIVNGAVRDVNEIKAAGIAVYALASCPLKSTNRGASERNTSVRVGGEIVRAGDLLMADADGIIVIAK